MERLTPLAAAFLEAENVDPTASMAIGSFAIFDGPAPDFEDFVTSIAGRLPLIPRYRQKLRSAPFDLVAPGWVDDPDFDLRWHIRNTALPAPGGRAEIGRLMSRVMSRRMDRGHPLWEYWFCEGLSGGRWGLLSKMHHSMVDGVSGTDLYQLVLDPTPTRRPPVTDTWSPAEPTSRVGFAAGAVRELVASPGHGVVSAARLLKEPRQLAQATGEVATGLLALVGAVRPVHSTSLTGPIDGNRRYACCEVSLGDIREVRKAFGVTVNDVALAAVTGGLRRLLLARGETPDPRAVRSLVPVSTRAPDAHSTPDNRVSLMLPYLPVDLEEPRERLSAVQARIRSLRAQHEPEAGGSLTSAAEWGLFPSVSWGIRMGMRFPQRQIATVTTNVPGPRSTLYGLGCEVQALLPYVPIADRVRIGVAMFSYRDTLVFGITGDYDTTPDIDVLTDGISDSLAELVREAEKAS